MNIKRLNKYVLGTAVAACLGSQPAMAEVKETNLDVTATVTTNCTISTSPVAFGNIDVTTGSAKDGTGSLIVTCTAGTLWNAFANEGTGAGATAEVRKMTMTSTPVGNALGQVGVSTLDYTLYTDSARSKVWHVLDGDNSIRPASVTGATGLQETVAVYGTIFADQRDVPAGGFKDTVVVSLTF